MEDVEQFHQIESNAHVKHFLGDARTFLRQMVLMSLHDEDPHICISVFKCVYTCIRTCDFTHVCNVFQDLFSAIRAFFEQNGTEIFEMMSIYIRIYIKYLCVYIYIYI